MAYKVYLVSPTGVRRLAGGVKRYKVESTADAAVKYYRAFIQNEGKVSFKGWTVEKVEV